MTRDAFLARLRDSMRGMPAKYVNESIADYEAHFADGLAAGRTEAEIAAALGDPARLARELRAEMSVQRWEQERNPSAAAGAVFAVLGLGAIDILILLPILFPMVLVLFGLFIAVIVLFFAGAVVMTAMPFTGPPGGPFTFIFLGLGIMAGSASAGAVLMLITIGFVNALVWYARLHYRLLKPAIEPEA